MKLFVTTLPWARTLTEQKCLDSPYVVLQLYVEEEESDTYLQVEGDEGRITNQCMQGANIVCLGKRIYGSTIDFINLVEKRVTRGFAIVLPPDYANGLYIPRGSPIEPIPVEGVRVSLEVCEGVKVKKWDTIGYVLTRKREMRRVKAHVSGIVVYVYSSPVGEREEDIVIIAPEEVVRHIRVRRE